MTYEIRRLNVEIISLRQQLAKNCGPQRAEGLTLDAEDASTPSKRNPSNAASDPLQKTINNLVKRINRLAFGSRNIPYCHVQSLLYACNPNWVHLDTITPP